MWAWKKGLQVNLDVVQASLEDFAASATPIKGGDLARRSVGDDACRHRGAYPEERKEREEVEIQLDFDRRNERRGRTKRLAGRRGGRPGAYIRGQGRLGDGRMRAMATDHPHQFLVFASQTDGPTHRPSPPDRGREPMGACAVQTSGRRQRPSAAICSHLPCAACLSNGLATAVITTVASSHAKIHLAAVALEHSTPVHHPARLPFSAPSASRAHPVAAERAHLPPRSIPLRPHATSVCHGARDHDRDAAPSSRKAREPPGNLSPAPPQRYRAPPIAAFPAVFLAGPFVYQPSFSPGQRNVPRDLSLRLDVDHLLWREASTVRRLTALCRVVDAPRSWTRARQ